MLERPSRCVARVEWREERAILDALDVLCDGHDYLSDSGERFALTK